MLIKYSNNLLKIFFLSPFFIMFVINSNFLKTVYLRRAYFVIFTCSVYKINKNILLHFCATPNGFLVSANVANVNNSSNSVKIDLILSKD